MRPQLNRWPHGRCQIPNRQSIFPRMPRSLPARPSSVKAQTCASSRSSGPRSAIGQRSAELVLEGPKADNVVDTALLAQGSDRLCPATEGLLEGLVDVATALRIAPFVASVILSGLEAENIAVGLAAGSGAKPRSLLGPSSAVPRSCSARPSAWAR